jgi:hypothetical protein
MANPTVRLVTVSRKKDIRRSIAAFQDELLNNLGWNGAIDYFVYGANNDTAKLQTAVGKAVADAKIAGAAGQPAVIVASGLQATTLLQTAVQASPIPIVQAAGGDAPQNPQNYVTGFKINALAVAEYHLNTVNSQAVTVLYDDTQNTPSLKNFNDLVTYNNAHAQKAITQLKARTPGDLKTLDPTKLMNGFMLIPNAMYYNHCDDIAAYVDGKTPNGNPLYVYYPEREYKKAHNNDTSNVKVYGYNIPLTYRRAAQLVDQILDGSMVIPLPPIIDGVLDQDQGA